MQPGECSSCKHHGCPTKADAEPQATASRGVPADFGGLGALPAGTNGLHLGLSGVVG
jgi:hypothetical protein